MKSYLFLLSLMILMTTSVMGSNLSQFFGSNSGTLTGANSSTVCNASTYNQIRMNNTTNQLEYCTPVGDVWTSVLVNPVVSVQFTMTNFTNTLLSTLTTSSTVQTVGAGTGVISVSGPGSPQLSVAGGAWSTSATITAGQTLALRLTSSASYGTTNTATVSVGAAAFTWTVATTPCTGMGTVTINYSGSIVNHTVPAGCTNATLEVWGAQGGNAVGAGGLGAYMKGSIGTSGGTVYKVLVGQQGASGTYGGGGGGGSFVTTNTNTPIIIAGGGGGSNQSIVGGPGLITNNGANANGVGGSSGNGGLAGTTGSNGGAGLTGNGGASPSPAYQVPLSFVNGGTGGIASTPSYAGAGGFGGGSGAEWTVCGSAGAGGGYSGGGGACSSMAGAGGGSYNAGTSQTNTSGLNSGNGKVVFTYLP